MRKLLAIPAIVLSMIAALFMPAAASAVPAVQAGSTAVASGPLAMAAATSTRSCSTGGYWYETDTFYITRSWNSEYGQYTYRVNWGGNRYVDNAKYYHKLESVRIYTGNTNTLITKFNTTNAANEVYWLNTAYADFNMTVRITIPGYGTTWYRACRINF